MPTGVEALRRMGAYRYLEPDYRPFQAFPGTANQVSLRRQTSRMDWASESVGRA